MSKLDKEFKEEFDSNYRKGMYVILKVGLTCIVILVVLTIFGGIGKSLYTSTIGKSKVDAETDVFKSSVAYTEQASSFLAKSYKEYNDAESDSDKKAVMEYVIMRYPNLDTDSIDNDELQEFYIKCLNK